MKNKLLKFLFSISLITPSIKAFEHIQCLSIPRSGHHLLIHILFKYFRAINHPKYNDSKAAYCNFFDCCQTSPCKNGKIVLKNHDLRLDVPFEKNVKYIVQYRENPILQFRSEHRKRTSLKNIPPMTFNNFLNYSQWGVPRILYWRDFVLKNINNHPFPENTYFLEYYDLVKNPFKHVKAILEIIFEEPSVNDSALETVIRNHNVKLGNHYSSAEYDFLKCLLPKPLPSRESLSESYKHENGAE